MGSEWTSLSDIVRIKGGKRLPKGCSLQSTENSHPYIRVKDMGSKHIPRTGLEYVPDEVFPKIKGYIVEENDVIVSIVGSVGLVSVIDEHFHFASQTENCAKLTGLNKVDAEYLYYCLVSPAGQREIAVQTVGAVQSKLPLYGIERIQVPWPHKDVRSRIAHILGSLDDKIELNRQMNATLEAMAQALFQSWFVDFDPVIDKALAAGNPIPEALQQRAQARRELGEKRKPLPADVARHFPDRFVFTEELGWVPEGWEVGTLEDIVEQRNERANPSPSTAAVPYVPIDCISTKSLFLESAKNGSEAQSSLIKFRKNDILFGAMRPYFHKVCISPFDGTTRTTAFVLYPKVQSDFAFCVLQIHEPRTIEHATSHSTGTTIPYAKWDGVLSMMPIAMPKRPLRSVFNDSCSGLLEAIPLKFYENQSLVKVRETLLPKLLSGELRVPDAERLVAEV